MERRKKESGFVSPYDGQGDVTYCGATGHARLSSREAALVSRAQEREALSARRFLYWPFGPCVDTRAQINS